MAVEMFAWLDNLIHTQISFVDHMKPADKHHELLLWEETKDGPRGAGGAGFPDDRIIPLCTRINKLSGICTLQSCAGHPRTEERQWSAPGNLWLWFGERTFDAFVHHASKLAEDPLMEGVDLLYGRYRPDDRRVVASLIFHADDKEPSMLEHSGDVILDFLVNLPRGW